MDINNPSDAGVPGDVNNASPGSLISKKTLFFIGIIFILLILIPSLVRIYSDYLWFSSLQFEDVFLTALFTKLEILIGAVVLFFVVLYINAHIALKKDKKQKRLLNIRTPLKLLIIGIVSLLAGMAYRNYWMIILQYINQTGFNVTDPIFSKDIAFYVFSLPFYSALLKLFMSLAFIAFIATMISYYVSGNIKLMPKSQYAVQGNAFASKGLGFSRKAKRHLSLIGAFFFLLMAAKYYLGRFQILYSPTGIVNGAGYTDVYVALPVYTLLMLLSIVIAAILVIGPMFFAKKKLIMGIIGAFVAILVLGQVVVPAAVQYLIVLPNEIEKEKPFIERNIEYTNMAYGLDNIEANDFPASEDLSLDDINNNMETIGNIRLWDPRPLKQTYKQLQEIRLYYDFLDVDIDRYTINDKYTQVMLSPRELSQDQLPENAKTWVNEHLAYTHGYGLTMSPVNRFTEVGLPELYVKDLPPKTDMQELSIERPEIYYGEATREFVMTKTNYQEFDYPKGDENQYTTYEGTGGVPVGSLLRKLVMAIRFNDFKMLLTGYITKDSVIMFNRQIQKRVNAIAPFIFYDPDPYMVVADNRLFWIMDGYTIASSYPYSESLEGINYIRNSVKVVIDAYNGDLSYYIMDKEEPVISTYRSIFPSLFKDFSQMPDSLKEHVRYPEQLFKIQSRMYSDYHMKDPVVFYNKEDKWDIPNEVYGEGRKIIMEPYYIIMKLPGKEKSEFIIMIPFTPHKKDNMIGWMAARSDEEYGKLVVYKFPKEKLIYGPMQVEARIDQNPEISEQLTLWDQRGSSVIRGNLIVVPLDSSILYIEPLYLLAEKTQLPELKRVLVYHGTKVVMEKDLETALKKLFGEGAAVPSAVKGEEREETETIITGDNLIQQAIAYYNQVQNSMRQGDWTGIGDAMQGLQDTLNEMEREG